MERSTVIPPLLHAVLELRTNVEWDDPRAVTPEIQVRKGVCPIGGGPVARCTITVPDVHASVMALIFRPDFDTHVQVSADDTSKFLGVIDAGDVNAAHGHVTSPSLSASTVRRNRAQRSPPTDGRSAESQPEDSHTPGGRPLPAAVPPDVARLLICPDRWFHPTASTARKVEECVFVGGGVTDENTSCPVGFPNAHPSTCPASVGEALVYFYFGLPVPAAKSRDFVCRAVGMEDLCAGGSSTMNALRREAVGVQSGHREAYAAALCSCSGALPALKQHVRGGVVCSVVIEGVDKDTPGFVMDTFVGLDVGVKYPGAFESWHVRDMENFVALARRVSTLFEGKAIDISDAGAMDRARAIAARERVRHNSAAADVGCGAGLCVLQ